MTNIGLVMLHVEGCPKLAVGQWIARWVGLPGGNFVCCLIIVVIFMGPEGALRLGGDFKVITWGGEGRRQATTGWEHFLWEDLTSQYTMYFYFATARGMKYAKWVKNGAGKSFYISCNYSCTISFTVKILLVKLKNLYI